MDAASLFITFVALHEPEALAIAPAAAANDAMAEYGPMTQPAPEAVAVVLPPATPIEVPAEPAAPPEPNRGSCVEIIGTDFLSGTERTWYLDHCMTEPWRFHLAAFVDLGQMTTAGTVTERFVAGYVEAGGPEVHLSRIINRVIPCESGGNPAAYSRVGPFYGLMQFLGSTWNAMGGGDWQDPYIQGFNTAKLLHRANPATQWPVCWFR